MILPNDDEVKERGVKICIKAVHEFFTLVFPEVVKQKGINFDDDILMTYYSLASSDEDYVQMIAKVFDVNLDAEAIDLPSLKELEEGAREYVNQLQSQG
jgi:hypothetical protein